MVKHRTSSAVAERQGLNRAQEICRDRVSRARELKGEGKKVVGYLCIYSPLEMMTALDLVPYRILGDMREAITRADAYLPTIVCPFLRSCLDLGLKGKYDFLNGVVLAHCCDVSEKLGPIWKAYVQTPFSYFLDIPHSIHEAAQEQHENLLKDFQKALESFAGKKLDTGRLAEAVRAHNEQRALVRHLYDLRKPDPPLISGTEVIQALMVIMSLPVGEGNDLLREVIDEVKERKGGPVKKTGRLLVWGSITDDTSLVEMVEGLDANVVMDDTCVGSRAFFSDVKPTPDPLKGLAQHYLLDLKCPRTFRENIGALKRNYMADLEDRFGYLKDYIRDWRVNGVILQAMRYCDSHGFEVPGLKDYLGSIGLPSLYLEPDYSEGILASFRTRVQAFLEMID